MRFLFPILLVLLFVWVGCGHDNSTDNNNVRATITGFSPATVNRGDQGVNGKISGSNLTGVSAVNLGAGITVKSFTTDSSTQITVKFNVSRSATAGGRTISVTTVNGTITSGGNLLTIDRAAPVAVISSGSKGNTSEPVHFDGSKSFNPDGVRIVEYLWDFADGTKKVKGQSVDHKFGKKGTFNVGLQVTDNKGGVGADTKKVEISVETEIVCKKKAAKGSDRYGRVIAGDQATKTVTVQLYNQASCSTAYYKCGDLKKGGDGKHGKEVWFGVICSMTDLGNNTFRIKLGGGEAFPPIPESDVYLHWQICGSGALCH